MIHLTAPSILQEEIEKFSQMAETWWDEKGKFKPLHQLNPVRIRFIQNAIKQHFYPESSSPEKALKLLDIGCGGGLLCEPMARLGYDVTGIDAAERSIKIAALHADQMNLTINYQHTSVEAMADTHHEAFDIVLAMEIIEHVADVESFIKRCCDLLKPGGIIFLATINRTMKAYMLAILGAEYVLGWLPRGTHQWDKFLKPSEVAHYLANCAVDTHSLQGVGYQPLKGTWECVKSLDINYMLFGKKT